jgi:uncharacterized protein YkwD
MDRISVPGPFGLVKRWLAPVIVAAALSVLAPAPTWAQAPTADALKAMEDQVFVLVNQARAAAGLAPYTRASELDASARRHSLDMATTGNFSHYGTDGSSPTQRAHAAGYDSSYVGENIAAGKDTAQGVMDLWMNEPPPAGHRAAILSADYKEIGISVFYQAGSPYGYYWTQDFGARAVAPPEELSPSGYTLTSSVRSVAATTPTSIEFVNQTAGVISVFWINYGGEAVGYQRVQPGQSYVQPSYVTFPWLVTDAYGLSLGIYMATERPGRAVIRHNDLAPQGANAGPFRSIASTTPTSIEFVNQTAGVVFVSWIDYQGGAVLYASLQPGQAYVQQTYVTHPWIVLDANARTLGIYTATERPGRAVIGG